MENKNIENATMVYGSLLASSGNRGSPMSGYFCCSGARRIIRLLIFVREASYVKAYRRTMR